MVVVVVITAVSIEIEIAVAAEEAVVAAVGSIGNGNDCIVISSSYVYFRCQFKYHLIVIQ